MKGAIKIVAVSVCSLGVHAFSDASPFLALSTSNKLNFPHLNERTSCFSHQLTPIADELSKDCTQDAYIIVSQPGISSRDFQHKNAAPNLRRILSEPDENIKSSISIPNLVGSVDVDLLQRQIESRCKVPATVLDVKDRIVSVSDDYPQILRIDLPALSTSSDRASQMKSHDSYLNAILYNLKDRSHTLIYTSTPLSASEHRVLRLQQSLSTQPNSAETEPVDSEEGEDEEEEDQEYDHLLYNYNSDDPFAAAAPLHEDFKRDLSSYDELESRAPKKNETADDRGLFETYNFLSPGLFMGLLATLLLGSILYVAVSAISSLEVSYGAFSKEMGPAAQKKQG
ncbi:MAG: hypothetical protein M1831_002508 [Alyxoria varia]|nr:MAG: hypothetical protein M1831_002508 [Alyxoria varia]